MSELKPCPFCGAKAKVIVSEKNHDSYQIIGCGEQQSMLCPTPITTAYRNDDGEFDYTYWNRRVEQGVNKS